MGLSLINPMEVIMVTEFFLRLFSAFARARVRKCASKMMQMDEHLLRDIGLTQSDVVQCLSSQPHKAGSCLPGRRSENLENTAAAADASARLSANPRAAPPSSGLAA
jgi:uncharacterized protein YjiS (DUF1127 family)